MWSCARGFENPLLCCVCRWVLSATASTTRRVWTVNAALTSTTTCPGGLLRTETRKPANVTSLTCLCLSTFVKSAYSSWLWRNKIFIFVLIWATGLNRKESKWFGNGLISFSRLTSRNSGFSQTCADETGKNTVFCLFKASIQEHKI